MYANPFSAAEIERRLDQVRRCLAEKDLAAGIFAAPENVFYLTGLDHWGYFAPHLLLVPVKGVPQLVTRAMERVSVKKQVSSAEFRGHGDNETAADLMARVLRDMKLTGNRIGLECWSSGLSHGLAVSLKAQADAEWNDISGLADTLRLVKSHEEQALMRQAAHISDIGAAAAIELIADRARECDVAAAAISAMTKAGGHPPGFGPFIRPSDRLGEEHATWGASRYRQGEPVFLELSGCISRYHAPLGRLIHVGSASDEDLAMAIVAQRAFDAAIKALAPAVLAKDVYSAWQQVVDDAGLSHYQRHHCGYCVGIGVPPSWTGGHSVIGLRADSNLEIKSGMSFHILSWLMGTGRGDSFVSNTVLLGSNGREILTTTPIGPIIK
jgi:Xaa-Pro aminopeptidase